ncbi:unnamed protein product [Mytilus coruscus]|uniref:Uncharacterized protein n=1 Tax=Mytilus coruscus TaxID=42192 RepID=A0A6J8AWM9_MYTCO|nr:unnamed protein product [Mytilus coruscus]
MERKKDDEATPSCGDHVKKLLAKQFGKNNKPIKFKLKQSDTERGCVKIKLNDESSSFKLSVDFKNSKMDMVYDNFKRQNSMKTCRRNSSCGIKQTNQSRPVSIEQSTEINHNTDFSTEINSKTTDMTYTKEHEFQTSTEKEQQLDTKSCMMIDNNSICYTQLKCKRKEIEKQYGSTVLVGTPERWYTLNAAVTTYTNSEYNVSSSLFVNIERTPEHNSATFWHPVDKLDNEKIVELCHGALIKTNTSISSDLFKNLDDVSTNASLSTNSGNHMSDQNKIETENKRTTLVQKELTASNYSQTSENNSEIKFEQAQAIQEEGCRRKKVTSKVKGQTRHAPQKPFYIITTQDEEVVRQLLLDFPLHDFVRKETNHFFRNEHKMHFTRPSVPIPSMHPLLPYKLRYLDEVEPSEHHVIETSSAPTEPESQDSDLHNEEEYFI